MELIRFEDIKKGDRLEIHARNNRIFKATAQQDALINDYHREHPDARYVNVKFDYPQEPYSDPYKWNHPNDTIYGPEHRDYPHMIPKDSATRFEEHWVNIYWLYNEKEMEIRVTTDIEQAKLDVAKAKMLLEHAQENLAKATEPQETPMEKFVREAKAIPPGSLVRFLPSYTRSRWMALNDGGFVVVSGARYREPVELWNAGYSSFEVLHKGP